MLNPILAGITSFLISISFLPFIIRFTKKKRIVARPGKRRIHKRITPSLGGVAIFLGFAMACIGWSSESNSYIVFLLLPVLIIPFIIGLVDDLVRLEPIAKLVAQLITASLIFFTLDIRLTSFYGLGREIIFPVAISYSVTLFTIVLITNSLNLIDGIDGLAATFSVIACICFGTWFMFTGEYSYALVCLALTGSILAFLFQNWEPSRIFMGDTGSLVIGTVLSVVMIHFMNQNYALDAGDPLKFNSSVGAALCVLIIPLVDTGRIIIIRLYNGISPLTADKRHIHHVLVRLGLSHRQAVYILTLVHVGVIIIAVALRNASQWVLLTTVVSLSIALCIILDRLIIKRFEGKEDIRKDVREIPH